MKIFLTGATGFIGSQLAMTLAEQGHEVCALVRSTERAQKECSHRNITFFEGSLDNITQAKLALKGCEQAYFLAAFAQVWSKDPNMFFNINVTQNLNLIKLAFSEGVKKVVVTSTAGVFGPSKDGEAVSESSKLWTQLTTDYELSKFKAESELKLYALESGNHLVIVNPCRVYGPGKLSQSNSVTRMIADYARGKWHVYPGNGKALGNYVFVEDVINGHLLAMEKGTSGENYILGGENASYRDLFSKTKQIHGKGTWLIGIPISLMMLIASVQTWLIPITGKGPLLTKGFVKKYNYSWINSSKKAENELGYSHINLDEGIKKVLEWSA
ncbi:MAG: NAD-dependent epimerase/dehydratase family protein [Flavobacteriales bacterium]